MVLLCYFKLMKNILYVFIVTFSLQSFAFMSGIDESRDTQGELEISGAHIPLGPPGMMSVGYLKIKNTSDKEHVTKFFYRNHKKFKIFNITSPNL